MPQFRNFPTIPIIFNNPKQLFINQKEIPKITKISKKIQIIQKNSYNTNIIYLTHNDKIYNFFSKKNTFN